MKEQLDSLLKEIKSGATSFSEVLKFIDARFQHHPTAFKNGEAYNEATQNQGSARVFAFAQLNELGKEETLSLFAEHYQSVLAHPDAVDHQNIRQFMANGWAGIQFDGVALTPKA